MKVKSGYGNEEGEWGGGGVMEMKRGDEDEEGAMEMKRGNEDEEGLWR